MKFHRLILKQLRKIDVVLLTVTSVGLGIAIVLQAHIFSKIVDRAFLRGESLQDLPILTLFFIVVTRSIFIWLNNHFATSASLRIRFTLREKLLRKIIELGPTYTSGERTGELTSTLTEGVDKLDPYIREYIPQVILTAVIPIMVLFFVFPRDFYTGAVFVITAPLIPFFMVLIGMAAEKVTKKQWRSLGRMSAYLLDVIQGLTTLKILNRSRGERERLKRIVEDFRKTTIDVLKIAFISALTLELIATLSTAIVAVEIGLRLLYGKMVFQEAFFILLLAPEFYTPFRQLGAKFHAGMAGIEAASRITEILENHTKIDTKGRKPASFSHEIRFENVNFHYGKRKVLDDINLTIKKGERIALVGPTGSGKSTLVSLILRFNDPSSGRITVDGIPLNLLNIHEWRKLISWVPQTPFIFNATVLENIKIAKTGAGIDEIIDAAKKAFAHEFIEKLENGYHTVVGEHGMRLSGGQAQRIAIARAFLKNAPILILDEATSNLDPETEEKIRKAIENLMKGRTVIIIAHRLSTVVNADKIVVLRDGRIVEAGKHELLIMNNGFYASMVKSHEGV